MGARLCQSCGGKVFCLLFGVLLYYLLVQTAKSIPCISKGFRPISYRSLSQLARPPWYIKGDQKGTSHFSNVGRPPISRRTRRKCFDEPFFHTPSTALRKCGSARLRSAAPLPDPRLPGQVPLSGWAQMVAFAGSVELFQYAAGAKGSFSRASEREGVERDGFSTERDSLKTKGKSKGRGS